MKIQEVIKSSQCSSINHEAQLFSSECLTEYVQNVKTLRDTCGFPFKSKDIFDFVWGNIELSAEEVFLLDSPLLQRLRGIKQLGFANMVYCNADYSRFTHTLGVIAIAGRMAEKLDSSTSLTRSENYNFVKIVRLAALFHDVGHMYFSHVSEQFFTKNVNSKYHDAVAKALNYFRVGTGAPRTKMHEMISVMLVNTDQVKDMISVIGTSLLRNAGMFTISTVNEIVEYISSLIIGVPCDTNILPYSTIVNGPLDADKIDYLSRDSATTKVPIAVDVARLIQRLTVVNYDKTRFVPQPIWNNLYDNRQYQVMAVRYSARKACWQLHTARSIMFESVYQHQKKLTAETTFRFALEIFENYISGTSLDSFHSQLSLRDDFFNEFVIELLNPSGNKRLYNLIKKLHLRDLPKRVASISMSSMYTLSDIGFNAIYTTFEDEVIQNKNSKHQIDFFDNLKDEINNAANLMRRTVNTTDAIFSFIETLSPEDEKSDIDMLQIEDGNDTSHPASEVFKGEPWIQGKENTQQEYFLVTDVPERDYVFVALEKVLIGNEDRLRLKPESSHCSKYSKSDFLKLKHGLMAQGYYDNAVELIPDDILWEMIDKRMFASIIDKFRSFQGKDGTCINEASMFGFLRQFLFYTTNETELKSIYDGILRMLGRKAVYINRSFFQDNAAQLLSKISAQYPDPIHKQMIPLGSGRDSSTSWAYYLNDIKGKDRYNYLDVDTALKLELEETVLVFFDDGAYSGKQVVSIFQEMMGIPIDDRTTNECHTHELNDLMKQRLKESNVVLAYLCFNESARSYIIESLNGLGLKHVNIYSINSLGTKLFDMDDVFLDDTQKDLLKRVLTEIGEKILLSTKRIDPVSFKPRWDIERIKMAALGYNDSQQMVIFERNIPTYSITALWANGVYKEAKWRGLFQRTDKD